MQNPVAIRPFTDTDAQQVHDVALKAWLYTDKNICK